MNSDLRILIADDEPASREIIGRMLKQLPYAVVVGEAGDGERLVEGLYASEPDLVLLDVHMKGENGLELIRKCRSSLPLLQVIVITGDREYALEAFGVSALDYIVKPVTAVKLYQSVEKARQLRQQRLKAERAAAQGGRLAYRTEQTTCLIPLEDILFVEKGVSGTVVHTLSCTYTLQEPLSGLLERLKEGFVQSHRSYIINVQAVTRIVHFRDSHMVYFGDYSVPAYISKSRLRHVQSMLGFGPQQGLR